MLLAWFEPPECDGLGCLFMNALLAALYASFAAVLLWVAIALVMLPMFLFGAAVRAERLREAASWWWWLPFEVGDSWPPIIQWFLAVAALVLATVGGFNRSRGSSGIRAVHAGPCRRHTARRARKPKEGLHNPRPRGARLWRIRLDHP